MASNPNTGGVQLTFLTTGKVRIRPSTRNQSANSQFFDVYTATEKMYRVWLYTPSLGAQHMAWTFWTRNSPMELTTTLCGVKDCVT